MLVQKLEMGYCPNCVVTKGLGSWARGARQAGVQGTWHGRCARGHAWPGRAAGPAGCALGALSLF